MKKLVPVFIFGVIIFMIAKDRFPGLVNKAKNAAESVAGWTEDARKDDPVGYIDYASKELSANLEKFKAAQGKLVETKAQAQAKNKEYQTKHLAAVQLSEDARELFQAAEKATDGNGYPVTLLGEQYNRDQLIDQVKGILAERDLYADMTEQFGSVIASLDTEADKLRERVKTTEFHLTKLKAQREIVEIQQMTAEVDGVLAKVDEILGENHQALEYIDEPVRTVDELLKDAASGAAKSKVDETTADVLNFLET